MINEENIVSLLEQLNTKVDGLALKIEKLESDMNVVKCDVVHVKNDLKGTMSDILKLNNRITIL